MMQVTEEQARPVNNIYPLAEKLLNAKKSNSKMDPFKKDEFTLLKDIALDVVAANFHLYPSLEGVPYYLKTLIIEKTNKFLPTTLTAPYINEESYWKEACTQRWNQNNRTKIEMHGMRWKNAYLERHLQEYLENLESIDTQDERDKLISELKAIYHWIHNLRIGQMKCSLNMGIILLYLPLITNMEIIFGMKHAGFNYKKQAFGIKLAEAANLGDAIQDNCKNLLTLNLRENLIDDDSLRFIMIGLNMNISLMELNLSHNKISDQGARRIAKYLMRNEILLELDLSDNLIGYEGSRYLSQGLKINKTLQKISLRLNNFNDKAGAKFFKDIAMNRALVEINLSSNSLNFESASKISDYLADPQCSLKSLDISANDFGEESYETLKTGFFKNVSLNKLEIRGCKFKLPEYEKDLTEIIIKHDLNSQKIPFISRADYIDLKERKQRKLEEAKIKEELLAAPKKKPASTIQN